MVKILVLVVALFFRFVYLGVVPASLAHDEIDTTIQAHAFVQTGSDIEGKWKPWTLLPNSGVMGEWVPLINAAAAKLLPATPLYARFTTAVLSAVSIIVLWVLLEAWGVHKKTAKWTAVLLAISPWHILFSRTALEQPASLFLYITSWLFLTLLFKNKNSRTRFILIAVGFTLSYMAGYLTYHGYKFSLPFLTLTLTGWLAVKDKKKWLTAIVPVIVIGGLLAHTFINRTYYSSRSSEMVFSQTDKAAKAVDLERRQSLAPQWQKELFTNKIAYFGTIVLEKYLGIFSPDLLFLHGEENGVFSVWKTGYLSLFVIPLLIVGIVIMLSERRREQVIILVLLLLSPLTSVVQANNSYAFRSAMFFVLLHIIAGYGAAAAMKWLNQTDMRRWVLLPIVLIASLSTFAYFCYIYFYLTPVANANAYFFGDRLLGNYVRLIDGNKKIVILDKQPRYTYSNIVLARGEVNKEDVMSFRGKFSPSELDEYWVGNLLITRECPKEGDFDIAIIHKDLLKDTSTCPVIMETAKKMQVKNRALVSPQDSGEERRIIGDSVCIENKLSTYVHPTSLADFNLESMQKEEFCQKWVVTQ